MSNKIWYLGLDIGTASVGWAATDTEYKIIRKNKKRLWGVRLFEEATTADERRGYRSNRRRLARRKWRLNLLEELFEKEIAKIDSNFFLRLKESQYHYEDKTHQVPFAIFNLQSEEEAIEKGKELAELYQNRAGVRDDIKVEGETLVEDLEIDFTVISDKDLAELLFLESTPDKVDAASKITPDDLANILIKGGYTEKTN